MKHLSYNEFKDKFGNLGLTEWVKYNWIGWSQEKTSFYLRKHLSEIASIDFDDTAVVDLGSLTWTKANNKFYIQSQISDMKIISGWESIPNFLCTKYQVVGQVNIVDTMTDKSITMIYNSQKSVQIYDSELYSSMTSPQFKTAMSGVLLAYEKA